MITSEMTSSAQQDEAAVAAVQRGDPERYRELVERHERRVFAVAWSRLGDATLAEEVTQEAFIRAYRRLWLLGDGAKFSGWVNTIARRLAINFGLRHRRELNRRERWALENPEPAATHHSTEETDPLYTPETLRQTLAELPPAHRECLVLFYIEGKSGTEAAAALGISESALRVRLHRARAAMREQLEDKLEGSLSKLGPAKTLVPAIMAGVLASSSAKAATAGAGGAVLGALVKFAPLKFLISFSSAAFFFPWILLQWLFLRLELANYRDQEGFRARLFRQSLRWQLLWAVLMMAAICLLIPQLHFGSFDTFFLAMAGLGLLLLPFQIRRTYLNRSRYSLITTAVGGVLFFSCLLIGLGCMPVSWLMWLVLLQALLMARYQSELPMGMDYNLFLRGAEGLLKAGAGEVPGRGFGRRMTKEQMLGFARFLGARWLVKNHRWTKRGLELTLPAVNVSRWGLLRNLPAWSQDSLLFLQDDGRVAARLGARDRTSLRQLQGERLPADAGLETAVSQAVERAWGEFDSGDGAVAERALGQVPEAEVFTRPRTRMLSTQLQRGIIIGSILFVAATFFLSNHYLGSFPAFSLEDLSRQNYRRATNELAMAKTEEKRFYALDAVAKESFVAGRIDDAQNYAHELLTLLPKYKGDWNYGNAIQDANLVLGRIAVRAGNIAAAKKYLIAAGKSPGSPQMDSFGPNMTLASDLLEKGERDTVLEYFMLCRHFWTFRLNKLDEWTQEVMAGKTPDFGANLLY